MIRVKLTNKYEKCDNWRIEREIGKRSYRELDKKLTDWKRNWEAIEGENGENWGFGGWFERKPSMQHEVVEGEDTWH